MQDSGDIISSGSTLSPDESENEKERDPPPFQASTAEGGSSIQLSPKLCKMIVRFICGSVLGREEISRLLKKTFSVTPRNLMSLTLSQLLEVVSKKLARHKYVEIPDEPVDPSQLKMTMIKVNKDSRLKHDYLSSI